METQIAEHLISLEESSVHWQPFHPSGHVVLDIGCGRWGVHQLEETSPIYFGNHGAVRVVGVDMNCGDINYYKERTSDDPKYTFICKSIQGKKDIIDLIVEYQPTALKIDIEGSEIALLECSSEDLAGISEIAIEFHSVELNNLSRNKIIEWGFNLHTRSNFPWGGDVNGCWYGRR